MAAVASARSGAPTSRDEAVATVREAVEAGITFLDVAPSYGSGEAELVIGAAFNGRLPGLVGPEAGPDAGRPINALSGRTKRGGLHPRWRARICERHRIS